MAELTTDELKMIHLDVLLNREPPRVQGKAADDARAIFQKEVEVAKSKGQTFDIPFEFEVG